ncbi:MAG: hypothetical protein ACRDJ9_16685, partial [Dehalococcoidia bacterium]
MRLYRTVWTGALALATGLGATAAFALADLPTIVAGALLCGFVTGLVAGASVWASEHPRRLRTVATATAMAIAAIGWTALLGLVELSGPGALALVVLLGGAGLPLLVQPGLGAGWIGGGRAVSFGRGSDAELRAR